jgi:co-chaperonin GroES (HSP10)
MYKACGHFLIIELDDVPTEKVSAGGIVLQAVGDANKKEQAGMSVCTVVDIGPNCWVGHYNPDGDHVPWCKVDDRVMIAKYAGQEFPIPDELSTEEKERMGRMRLIKDDDVLAVEL